MDVPSSVKKKFDESKIYFPSPIQMFQFLDKYSRFDYEKGRRETWIETISRSVKALKEISDNKLPVETYDKIEDFMLHMKASPSMRLLAMAGKATRRSSICLYNCSYLPMDSIDSLVEELIVAMAGTGVGYSVEKIYVDKFPEIKIQTGEKKKTFIVKDSTEGWADALKTGLETWFNGEDIEFDYSKIRKAGAPLKIKGGRASGPEPLKNLLDFTRKIVLSKQGDKLSTLNVHDLCCKVGEAIVSGGVRRSALICLFDSDDKEMRDCKNGDLTGNEQRWMSNNSAVWDKVLTQREIYAQMYEMDAGQRGEPGIFSRKVANDLNKKRNKGKEKLYGTNPCGEVILRPYSFCNLSIAIARENDTLETLKEKIEIATIIGTIQSMATNFPGLRDDWKKNCEEERLLGVDITGWVDCPLLHPTNRNVNKTLKELKDHVIKTNKKYAKLLGINKSASTTCVKPSGNSALLFDCSSGIHPRQYPYYIRNIRIQTKSPLKTLLQNAGVPMDPENGQTKENATSWVIHFPVKSPEGAIFKDNMSALEQCKYWLKAKKYWTTHNPSVTIYYKPDELIDLVHWVNRNKKYIGGMSFLPSDNANYKQMPYEPITKEEYEKAISTFPDIDWSQLYALEKEDFTNVNTEMSCSSGVCSLDEYMANKIAKELHIS